MKYLKSLFLACFVSLMLVSCGDDSNPTSNSDISKYRPTTLTFSDSLTNEKYGSEIFHYTGKLLTSADFLNEKDEIAETITFEYDGDKLIKRSSSRNSTDLTFEYYADGKLKSRTETEDDGEYVYASKYQFIYNGDKISKVEMYDYNEDSGVWETEPSGMYEYFYNDSKQLISRISKYRYDVNDEWEFSEKLDTLLYTNSKVSQYRIGYDDDDYMNYFFAYDTGNRLNNVRVESDSYDITDALSFVYDNENVATIFFKNDYDSPKLKIAIEWEKQESNVFEVSKLLMLEEPLSTISDYFNLFLHFIQEIS